MADNTAIEWADATWQPITGCSVVSPGCTNCYAMRLAGTRLKHHPSRAGLTREVGGHHVWTGETRFNEAELVKPLRWKRPRRVFVCAHGDLFHESVPDEWIDRVFAVMALARQHTFQVLTKRASRMRDYCKGPWQPRLIPYLKAWQKRPAGHGVILETANGSLPNVWLGVSVEDQARADERIPDLLATPAAVRWLSCEPLLGPVDLREVPAAKGGTARSLFGPLSGYCPRHFPRKNCGCPQMQARLDWIVVGGESGPDARPMHPDWARSLRDQCRVAGKPFFFKQFGEWLHSDQLGWWPYGDEAIERSAAQGDFYRVGKKPAGRLLDGREWSEFPANV
jgi:protein gp37